MRVKVYLSHGASGSARSMAPHVEGLRQRGVTAEAVQLPRGAASRALSVYRAAVPAADDAVIGGHSFGGRVASMLATEGGYRALVLLSYPLHRPGRPETAEERTAHWRSIDCPVLLLSGQRDPFARIDPLRTAVRQLRTYQLVTYPGIGHGLGPVLDDALDRIAAFVARL